MALGCSRSGVRRALPAGLVVGLFSLRLLGTGQLTGWRGGGSLACQPPHFPSVLGSKPLGSGSLARSEGLQRWAAWWGPLPRPRLTLEASPAPVPGNLPRGPAWRCTEPRPHSASPSLFPAEVSGLLGNWEDASSGPPQAPG